MDTQLSDIDNTLSYLIGVRPLTSCPNVIPAADTNRITQKRLHMDKTEDVSLEFAEGATPLTDLNRFDPFKERNLENSTTDCQTLTHLLKSTLGSGIMALPSAFSASGIVGGILGGLFMATICTHTSYILIDCAHKLYVKAHKTKMEYTDVVETALTTGPPWIRKYAKYVRQFVSILLFSALFGACVADNILMAENYNQVLNYYKGANITSEGNVIGVDNENSQIRAIMACLLVPLILFVWVPDLKYLAPISTVANFSMATVLAITFYYLVQDPKPMNELKLFQPITYAPQYISITLFAMENIGVMMPLENNMKTPQNFLGVCGVLNKGMSVMTVVYILFGVLGYMKYGEDVQAIVTASLPVQDIPAQIVKILIATTVLLSFSLQFYVCREMVWTSVEKYFPSRPRLAEYTIRALLVIACVSIAIAIPSITPIMTFVGAFGFSLLGIVCPAIIELFTYWDIGYGRYNWKIYKNALLLIFGIVSLISGSHSAVKGIVEEFTL